LSFCSSEGSLLSKNWARTLTERGSLSRRENSANAAQFHSVSSLLRCCAPLSGSFRRRARTVTIENQSLHFTMGANNGAKRDWFRQFSCGVANCMGASWAFTVAVFVIILWAISGPFFHFSNTWQLVINTATTIITFLMVFLIQNTQNRDAKAIHLKLDELIRSTSKARNVLIDLQNMSDDDLAEFQHEFEELRIRAQLRYEQRIRKQEPAAQKPRANERLAGEQLTATGLTTHS
jgi:low affinity Fe/Cu permease